MMTVPGAKPVAAAATWSTKYGDGLLPPQRSGSGAVELATNRLQCGPNHTSPGGSVTLGVPVVTVTGAHGPNSTSSGRRTAHAQAAHARVAAAD